MPDEPPRSFDFVQASFWLVAAVIAAQVLAVFVSLAVCVWNADAIIAGKWKCDADNRLGELLAAALAAALGFAGGRMSR